MSTLKSKNSVDKVLDKLMSRKLFVFVVACVGLFFSVLTSSDWVVVATAYVGGQAFVDVIEKIKK